MIIDVWNSAMNIIRLLWLVCLRENSSMSLTSYTLIYMMWNF